MPQNQQSGRRPLSPHLQVYKLPMTALMSISHRMSGFALSAGTLVVIWFLAAAASGPGAYEIFMDHAGAWYGKALLFGWSVALFYHLSNGIRHLFWDMGFLFKLENARASGFAVLASTAILTAVVWYFACPF